MLSREVSAPHEECLGSMRRRAQEQIAALFYKLRSDAAHYGHLSNRILQDSNTDNYFITLRFYDNYEF